VSADTLTPCDALVLFGATGDLAGKMVLPALARLGTLGVRVPIVGVSRRPIAAADVLERVRERLAREDPTAAPIIATLADRFRCVSGDAEDPRTYEEIRRALGDAQHPLHYLAIPPELFAPVTLALGRADLARGARIALEKPFGRDLESARALERTVEQVFPEESIFRIDHFLGKDPVHNLADMRCSTAWLEPLWSHANVRSVQITMAEAFGIGTRGSFYEDVGVLRDVFQNHLLQLVALVAMEPVPLADGEAFGNARIEALRAIEPLEAGDVVYGQYEGYRDEPEVARDSQVATYMATRLHVDTPRFAGVPFYVRTGKRLAVTATTISLALARLRAMRTDAAPDAACDHLRFRIGPGTANIVLETHRLAPHTRDDRVPLSLAAALPSDEDRDAYVNLLGAALAGDHTISVRATGVTAAWRVVEPVLHADIPVHRYAQASWGPAEADRLLVRGERWYDPPP
jgi:glucose-6-phosphate 1-dehydrogenase